MPDAKGRSMPVTADTITRNARKGSVKPCAARLDKKHQLPGTCCSVAAVEADRSKDAARASGPEDPPFKARET